MLFQRPLQLTRTTNTYIKKRVSCTVDMRLYVTKKISVGFAVAVITTVVTGAALLQIPLRQNQASDWIEHTHLVLTELETALSTMKDAETGQRGYLLTGDKRYLEPYYTAVAEIDRQLQELKELTADNPNQQRRIVSLEREIRVKLAELKETILLRQTKGFKEAWQVVISGKGNQTMDAIRSIVAEMKREENQLLEQRNQKYQGSVQRTIQTFLGLMSLNLALIILTYYLVNRDLKERKQRETTQQQLLKQIELERQHLDAVLSHMPAGVVVASAPSGKLILGNKQVEQIWRHSFLSANSIIEYREYKGFHADGRPYEPQEWPLARSVSTGEVVREEEINILRGDGTRGTILISSAPIYNDAETIVAAVVTFFDITQRKQVEKALEESEERFRHMADNAPVMIWVTDSNGYCTYLSQGWYNFTGQTEETGLGFGWFDAVHPEDREYAKNVFLEANKRREAFRLDYRLQRQDGEYRFCIDAASPRFGLDGHLGYIGSVIDITERKQAEAALRESEDRLRLAIHSADLGTWDWNLLTGELRWDAGCKALFSLPADAESNIEIFYQGLHPDDRDRLTEVVEWSLNPASGGYYDVEYRTVGIEDGVERWIAAKGQVYFDAASIPMRFIGTVLNITDRKRIEAERERLFNQEKAARAAAEAVNRIKDEFLAIISHELRTPLNPILGWSKLLQRGKLNDAKKVEAFSIIERNAQLQAQLVEDLLDMSRILQGKISLNVSPVNLVTIISSAVETVWLAAQAKSIQLEFVVEGHKTKEEYELLGDSTRLQQVMWNLLSNAVKFTPQGGRVEIRLKQVGGWEKLTTSSSLTTSHQSLELKPQAIAPSSYAQITVIDTGKGIKPDFLPYVFDRFRQEDSSITRNAGGLGLGLGIVKHLVELHGGSVNAESPGEGQGATFTVRLPLVNTLHQTSSTNDQPESRLDLSGINSQ